MKKLGIITLIASLLSFVSVAVLFSVTVIKLNNIPTNSGNNGVVSIDKTDSSDLTDTYTITYSDGSSSKFTVTNDSEGIKGIQGEKGADGHTPVITIGENGNWFIDGVDTTKSAQGLKGDTGNGISNIEKTSTEDLVDTYTITFTNGETTTFTVTNGSNGIQGIQGEPGNDGEDGHTPVITIGENGNWFIDGEDTTKTAQGLKGDTGNGISKIEKTSTEGFVDTYTIKFTNGETTTFTVTNGSQGIQGIQGEKGEDGHTPVITIGENGNWFIDGEDSLNSANAVNGDTGNGISNIEKTSTEDLVDTYTITFTNGDTTTFTVTNGSNGIQGIQGEPGNDGEDGHTPVITIGENGNWFIDGEDTTKKAQGLKGETGNGISKIEKTLTEGLVDTYTITFTNGTTTTFTVTNGGGESAFEIYLKYHPEYEGTEEDWINDLVNYNLGNKDKVNVCFYVDDDLYDEKIVNYGYGVSKPENPTKEGYIFKGWYYDDIEWNFLMYSVNQNIDLYAKFVEDSFALYTKSNLDGGSYTFIDDKYASKEIINLKVIEYEGYSFTGWYDSNNELVSTSKDFDFVMPINDVVLTAKFETIKFEVNYIVPEGTVLNNPLTFTYFTTITLQNPELKGHSFAGWFKEDSYINSVSVVGEVKENTTVYAKFVANTYNLTLNGYYEYTVTFNLNYSGSTNIVRTVASNNKVTLPANPTRSGYLFLGWYSNQSCTTYYNFSAAITKNITVYAKWQSTTYNLITNMYSYNSNTSVKTLTTHTGYSDGSGYDYYAFTAFESGNHDIYFKPGRGAWIYLIDSTAGTTLIDYLNITNTSSYTKKTVNLTVGHFYYFKVSGKPESRDGTDTLKIYGSGFSNIKSTGVANGTIKSTIKYGDTINYNTQIKPNTSLLGWYDQNNNLFTSPIYNVDYDLVLTAKFE